MQTAETWNITNVTFLPKRSKIMYVARQCNVSLIELKPKYWVRSYLVEG